MACQPADSEGFPPFMEDGHERTGPSSCTWHPRSIKLPDVGTISFTYENCDPEFIRDSSFYLDGNWVYFDYYEDSPRYDHYPIIGIFPLKGRDAETVLSEEVFSEVLKNPLCSLSNTTRNSLERYNQAPYPAQYPNRWHLDFSGEIWANGPSPGKRFKRVFVDPLLGIFSPLVETNIEVISVKKMITFLFCVEMKVCSRSIFLQSGSSLCKNNQKRFIFMDSFKAHTKSKKIGI